MGRAFGNLSGAREDAIYRVNRQLPWVEESVGRGDCLSAFRELMLAGEYAGVLSHVSISVNAEYKAVSAKYDDVKSKFIKACVRK